MSQNFLQLRLLILSVLLPCLLPLMTSCVTAYRQSIGGDTAKILHRIYLTDYNTAWLSVLDALKNSHMDVINREGGFLQTKWIENTSEKNFTDSFGIAAAYLKAQMRFRLNVAKGFYNGRETVKITLEKEQMVQQDVLEGWQPTQTDGVEENTLLYRVGRVIHMRMKLAQLEQDKISAQINSH